jgi:AraC family transcriptional regulator
VCEGFDLNSSIPNAFNQRSCHGRNFNISFTIELPLAYIRHTRFLSGAPKMPESIKGEYGEHLRRIEVEGLVCTESLRAPDSIIHSHAHEHTNIAMVIDGTFVETVGRTPHECNPFSLILRPAGESHSNRYSKTGARSIIMEVKPERLDSIRQVSSILDNVVHIRGGSELRVLMSRIFKEFQTSDSASALSIEALALEMLVFATRQWTTRESRGAPRWLLEARDVLHSQFAEPLTLSFIAGTVGVHPSHLAKSFRSHFHCTIGEYLRRLRLDLAAQLLMQSNSTIGKIAASAGFFDQSHFTHSFRSRFGMSPSEYRLAARRTRVPFINN